MPQPYSLTADLEHFCGGPEGLVEVFDFDKNGVADPATMTRAILAADTLIDSYANKQYLVPFVVVPQLVKDLSARIAVYQTRQAKRMVDPETHGNASKEDLQLLEDIRDGVVTLGVDPSPTKASSRVDASLPRSTSKEVSRKNLDGFR